MTVIAIHYAAAPEAAVFDTFTPVVSDLDTLETRPQVTPDDSETIDPPIEDHGKLVGRFAGGVALALGTISTLSTGATMAMQAAHGENVERTGIQLAKGSVVAIGALVFLKYGVPAVDRWWNKGRDE